MIQILTNFDDANFCYIGAIHILRTQKTLDFDPLPVALHTFSYPPYAYVCMSLPPRYSALCVFNVIYDRYFNIPHGLNHRRSR